MFFLTKRLILPVKLAALLSIAVILWKLYLNPFLFCLNSSVSMDVIQIRPGPEEKMPLEAPDNQDDCIEVLGEDPYMHIANIGSGVYGIVDKVEKDGKVYAEKKIRVTWRNRDQILKDTKKDILRRLRHHHVIEVVEVFQCKGRLRIIMTQVADTDWKEYMEQIDAIEDNRMRRNKISRMRSWPGCLIQAIDYLHNMKVKQRDIKPANILIMGCKVLIADFGLSKDLIDEETTASLMGAAAAGTPMYWAPEVISASNTARRGRAVDIFALGCIFLEIATLHMNERGILRRFGEYRYFDGSRAFGRYCVRIFRWMMYLISTAIFEGFGEHSYYSARIEMMLNLSQLAMVMLQPDPKMRISAQSLVAAFESKIHRHEIDNKKSCGECGADDGGNWVLYSISPLDVEDILEAFGDVEDIKSILIDDDDITLDD
jgi:serine/threonine protein kinase